MYFLFFKYVCILKVYLVCYNSHKKGWEEQVAVKIYTGHNGCTRMEPDN